MDKLASELGAESPEQIMALLEHLQGQEGLENISPDLAVSVCAHSANCSNWIAKALSKLHEDSSRYAYT